MALTEDGHAGKTYLITGPEVLTPRDRIRILSAATGRPARTFAQWAAEHADDFRS